MAIGKNKNLGKGKKGGKKKQADPFTKKNWYQIKAPVYFGGKRYVGRTMVTKTTGQKIETDGLRGRVCEFNLADVREAESGDKKDQLAEEAKKKVSLEILEITGKSCLTDFHSMGMNRDALCIMLQKKHSLIEAFADCKTADGYVLRLFCIAMTEKVEGQVKQLTYCQTAQERKIRKKMVEEMQKEAAKGPMRQLVKALVMETIESSIKKVTRRIFPLKEIHIMKAKIVKKPKFDVTKLFEIHEKGGIDENEGVAVNEDPEAPKNLLAEAK